MKISNFSYIRNLVGVASVSFALAGCFDDIPNTGPVQTVGWYEAHDNERQAMVEKCTNNPGELQNAPNCINAIQAERALTSGASFELDLSILKGKEDS